MDLVLGHARENELIDVRARHIEMQCRPLLRTARWRHRGKPPIDQVTFVPGCGEGIHEVRSDFIAAWTNARPDCRDQIRGPRTELASKSLHRGDRRSRRGTAPTGMHSSDDTTRSISHQQWNTVGRADRDSHIG